MQVRITLIASYWRVNRVCRGGVYIVEARCLRCASRRSTRREKADEMNRNGFTLIELIIVIAILGFVTVVGIHSYGNVREVQAKKVNLANIKRVYSALSTYEMLNREQGASGYFGGLDSLIDAASSGSWRGGEGTFDLGTRTETTGRGSTSATFDARQVHSGLGIYDGSWKVLGALYNAAGQGSGSTASISDAQEQNRGMRGTGLWKSLGIYYLTASDVELLRNAGIDYYYLHNPSTQQAYGATRNGYCSVEMENGVAYSSAADGHLKIMGGGPGFRPDMSAFYPTILTNGTPVAVLNPTSSAYDDFGYPLAVTNSAPTTSEAEAALASVKLLCFGVGKNAECVRSQIGLGEAPHNPAFDKKNYRNYIAVFALKAGGQGVASACRLAGVLDCAGNTYRAAEYDTGWSTTLGN